MRLLWFPRRQRYVGHQDDHRHHVQLIQRIRISIRVIIHIEQHRPRRTGDGRRCTQPPRLVKRPRQPGRRLSAVALGLLGGMMSPHHTGGWVYWRNGCVRPILVRSKGGVGSTLWGGMCPHYKEGWLGWLGRWMQSGLYEVKAGSGLLGGMNMSTLSLIHI